ncbi:MAG: DedA family protein [Desulfobacteraceae bacterium]|nr:MAG: DedA family protein [Desulfobacteraceae bacterium]
MRHIELVESYGYGLLFLGVLLEGETFLIAASFAAHRGYLNLGWVIAVAFLGTLAGDQIYFFLGRVKGRSFLRNRPGWQAKVEKAQRMLNRYQWQVILGFRFLYGLRTIIPFSLGLSEIKVDRFLLSNAAGALIWSIVVGILGFLFGQALEATLADIKKHEKWIIVAVLCIGCSVWILLLFRRRRLLKSLAAPPGEQVQQPLSSSSEE